MVELEVLKDGTAGSANTGGGGGGNGRTPGVKNNDSGAGGSGIVVFKELNQASGVWSMQSQFQARKDDSWPDGSTWIDVTADFLIVGGGGGGGFGGAGDGAGGGGAGKFALENSKMHKIKF